MKKIRIITGQTATGKTEHALELAHETQVDIISADSRQIYAGLDIITGKDIGMRSFRHIDTYKSWAVGYYLVDGVKIWGCDMVPPDQPFTTHNYLEYVAFLFENTIEQAATPIVVGGTYLYIQSLLNGLDEGIGPDWNLRATLEGQSTLQLQKTLQHLDPDAFASLNESDAQNPRRLIRRIEIAQGAKTNSTPKAPHYVATHIDGYRFSTPERLQSTIAQRVEKRIAAGAFEEVQKLLDAGYTQSSPGLQTIGYQQIIAHLQGQTTREEAIALWTLAETQYAKRQWTFMKRNQQIDWHSV
jgi:tRNA dimethylallyltransferase